MRWTAPDMLGDGEDGESLRPSLASDVYSLAAVMIEVSVSLTNSGMPSPALMT